METRKGFINPAMIALLGVIVVIVTLVGLGVGDACSFCMDWPPLGNLVSYSWFFIPAGVALATYGLTANPVWAGGVLVGLTVITKFLIGLGGAV